MFRYAHRLLRLATFSALCLCLMEQASARAGGAGGHSSGGSHGGSSHSSHSYGGSGIYVGPSYSGGSRSGEGLGAWPTLLILLFILYVLYKWNRFQKDQSGVQAELIEELPEETLMLAQIRQVDPSFDLEDFKTKVSRAFVKIQEAWSTQDISKARTFISDGVYQRYNVQFQMMRMLQQQNPLSDIKVHLVQPVAAWVDGPYHVIDVKITASMLDRFISGLDSSLDEEGDGMFSEYWSFIRLIDSGKRQTDLTSSAQCPSCGAQLPPSMGEICRCDHCQVMINSGEFDWILCEITQSKDYGIEYFPEYTQPDLNDKLVPISEEAGDLSVSMIEDKASNAMMQICNAYGSGKIEGVRRFVSDEVFAKLKQEMPSPPHAYSRLFLNDVSLLAVNRTEKRYQLRLGLALTRQRIRVHPEGHLDLLDYAPEKSLVIMNMERDISAAPPAGALYQHQCPCCGGAIADTTDTRCVYCGSELNSPSYEWIVTGMDNLSPL